MFTNHTAALAHLAIQSQFPANPSWSWGIRKIPGMQMWFVGQFWNAASN